VDLVEDDLVVISVALQAAGLQIEEGLSTVFAGAGAVVGRTVQAVAVVVVVVVLFVEGWQRRLAVFPATELGLLMVVLRQ
jgi:hypothetical protein